MTDGLLAAVVFAVAVVYASVGHAGATGYIAVMTLWGLDPEVIRPTALMLNVVVATIAVAAFSRAGHVDRRLLVPLVAAGVPAAAVGGYAALPRAAFETVVAAILAFAALRIAAETVRGRHDATAGQPPRAGWLEDGSHAALLAVIGGGIGLLSGLTGVGGGVFLTPVLMALGVAPVRTIAATSAGFILANSLAGLAGGIAAGRSVSLPALGLVAAAAAGGLLGGHLGARRLPVAALRLLMAAVLAVASLKSLL